MNPFSELQFMLFNFFSSSCADSPGIVQVGKQKRDEVGEGGGEGDDEGERTGRDEGRDCVDYRREISSNGELRV